MPAANPLVLFPPLCSLGPIAAYDDAFRAVVKDPRGDVLFLHFFVGLYPNYERLKVFKETADREGKLLVIWAIGRRDALRIFKREAQEAAIPVHGELYRAVEMPGFRSALHAREKASRLLRAAEHTVSRPGPQRPRRKTRAQSGDEFESKRLLKRAGIPVVTKKKSSPRLPLRLQPRAISDFPVVLKGGVDAATNVH
jgi:hypothetical protein